MGEVDPNTVRPGWIALLIVLALGGATVLLWLNMGKQMRRIDFDPDATARQAPTDAAPQAPAEQDEQTDRPDSGEQGPDDPVTERKPD